jgi:hypothetical protein
VIVNTTNQSEVARLRQQIAAEYAATEQALHGLAQGTAQHRIITARMERICACVDELADLVGIERASRIFAETLENGASDAQL